MSRPRASSVPALLTALLLLGGVAATPLSAEPSRVMMWILDGTRADRFHALLEAGRLPNFEAHVARRGLVVRDAVTVFPSTTGPTYAPFVTGRAPGSSGITGLRWYDRIDGTSYVYAGRMFGKINEALAEDAPTLYELLPPSESMSVFGFVDRGSRQTSMPFLEMGLPKLQGDYLEMDEALFHSFMEGSLERDRVPRFMFLSFHAPDSVGHAHGDSHPDYDASLVAIDHLLGRTVEALRRRGLYDSTYLVVSADHGQSEASQRMSLSEHLEGAGMVVRDCIEREPAFHNLKASSRRRQFDVHVEVNGNAAVFFYLHPEGTDPSERVPARLARRFPARTGQVVDVEAALLAAPATELVLSRERAGEYRVASREGAASLEAREGQYRYRILEGNDPLAYRELPGGPEMVGGGFHPADEWFRLGARGPFPDALHQVASFLESPRAPDMVVSAAPGWEPWVEGQTGLHGSLRREHMRVPLLVAGPDVAVRSLPRGRTVDVFPTVLEMLGLPPVPGHDGRALPWRAGPAPEGASPVLADGFRRWWGEVLAAERATGIPGDEVPGPAARQELAGEVARAAAAAAREGDTAPLDAILAFASRGPRAWYHGRELLAGLAEEGVPGSHRPRLERVRTGAVFSDRVPSLVEGWRRSLAAAERNQALLSRGRIGQVDGRLAHLASLEYHESLLLSLLPRELVAGRREGLLALRRARERGGPMASAIEDLIVRVESLGKRLRRHPARAP